MLKIFIILNLFSFSVFAGDLPKAKLKVSGILSVQVEGQKNLLSKNISAIIELKSSSDADSSQMGRRQDSGGISQALDFKNGAWKHEATGLVNCSGLKDLFFNLEINRFSNLSQSLEKPSFVLTAHFAAKLNGDEFVKSYGQTQWVTEETTRALFANEALTLVSAPFELPKQSSEACKIRGGLGHANLKIDRIEVLN